MGRVLVSYLNVISLACTPELAVGSESATGTPFIMEPSNLQQSAPMLEDFPYAELVLVPVTGPFNRIPPMSRG